MTDCSQANRGYRISCKCVGGNNAARPDAAGFFTADDVRIVLTAESLRGFGFDIRHLKSLRNTAQRQADLIGQVAGPVARSQRSSAKEKAADMGQQMTALVVSLHASLVKNALRDELA